MSSDLHTLYSERITTIRNSEKALQQKSWRIAIFRLVAFLAACIFFWLSSVNKSVFLFPGFGMVAAFLYLIRQYTKVSRELAILKIEIKLNENEQLNLANAGDTFDFSPERDLSGHMYANDLDVFGTLSLFRKINRTTTVAGKHKLAESLLSLSPDARQINEKQNFIKELSPGVDWRQRFYAIGTSSGELDTDGPRLARWSALPDFFIGRKFWAAVAAFASLSTVVSILLVILTTTVTFELVMGAFIFNTIIHNLFFRKKINEYFVDFGDFTDLFSTWSQLSALIDEKEFKSAKGEKIKAAMKDASQSLKEISSLNRQIGYRHDSLTVLFTNALCLFDIWFILQIENWRRKHGSMLLVWADSLAEMDHNNSLANFRFNHPTFTFANISTEHQHITAKALGHPLVAATVTNDFSIGGSGQLSSAGDEHKSEPRAHIITGSNMSGKSTLLRAVGTNMVLALNGLPVCAEKFSCSPMGIASCIRVNDSLEDNQSYFQAEIKRLSKIMTLLKTGEPYLVLLDEILRGTNSVDKKEGTLAFYRKLTSQHCLALLATHDPEIGALETESPGTYRNFHFESYVEDSDIRFDYILRLGVTRTKNASMLMKKLDLT